MSSDQEPIVLTREDAVLWVRLNRVRRRNAIDPDTCDKLLQVFKDAERDHDVRAIIVTGTGEFFCTGADLAATSSWVGAEAARKAMKDPPPRPPLIDARQSVEAFQTLYKFYWEMETPIVSAINGNVAGAGGPLALGADLVVAAEGARFNSVWTRGGMSAHAADPYFLPKMFPYHRLMEFALLGEVFTAEDLLRWDVINKVVPASELETAARNWAKTLASGPTLSMGQTKRLYKRSYDTDMLTCFAEEAAAVVMLSPSKDRQEGMAAIVERRKPKFIGR